MSASTTVNHASISRSGLPEAEVLIGLASRMPIPAPASPFSEERRRPDDNLTMKGAGASPAMRSLGPVAMPGGASAIARRRPPCLNPFRPSSSPAGSLGPAAMPSGASAIARRPPRLNPPVRPSQSPRMPSLTPNPANESPSRAEAAGLPPLDSTPTSSSHGSDSSTISPHPTIFGRSDESSVVSNRSDAEAAPGRKVIVFIANDSVTQEIHRRVMLIRNALIAIFPIANPIIGSAKPIITALDRQPVLPFLVHRISEQYSHRLTAQCCWTINNFTFFAVDFALPTTSYAMTLMGLHLPESQESEDFVVTLVRRWLSRSRFITSFIRKHHDNLPRFMSVEEQIISTIISVKVAGRKLGDEDDSPVAFNVYINPPTDDPLRHQQWLKEVRAITYFADCGTGKAISVFQCNICKARDHSDDSCSFPSNENLPQHG